MTALEKLEIIAKLQNNWDGYGATAFPSIFINKIKNLIPSLIVCPEIFPTANNSIQFEYNKADDSHLEIEIFSNNTAEVYIINDKSESVFMIPATSGKINDVIKAFYN